MSEERAPGESSSLPRQPELTPPPLPVAPVPSLAVYCVLVAVALVLIWSGFLTASDRWSSFWLNLGCNLLAVVVVLIVIEQRIRPTELSRVRGVTSGVAARAATLVWPEARDAAGYARSLMMRLGEVVPAYYVEVPELSGVAHKHEEGFVLVGGPGAGKTTFLHMLAMHKAKETTRSPLKGKLPIVFPLRRWKHGRGAHHNLREFVQQFYPMSDRRFHALLRRGRFMLFLDGLDDVPPDVRAAIVREILELRDRHPGTGLVISARPTSAVGGDELPVIEVPRLSPQQREDLLDRITAPPDRVTPSAAD